MFVQSYLKRINFKGDLNPSLELLNQLQKAYLLAIPFENLDTHINITYNKEDERATSIIERHNRNYLKVNSKKEENWIL